MKMNIKGTIVRVEDKVSKKGNNYTVVELIQEDVRYQYFNTMLDESVEINKEEIVGKEVELVLDYNPKYRSFKAMEIKY